MPNGLLYDVCRVSVGFLYGLVFCRAPCRISSGWLSFFCAAKSSLQACSIVCASVASLVIGAFLKFAVEVRARVRFSVPRSKSVMHCLACSPGRLRFVRVFVAFALCLLIACMRVAL